MFISIEKRKEKRRPPKHSWLIKDPVLKDYDKEDPDPWKYDVTGEKIPRLPEWKLLVKLRHTFREDGKVKGKSVPIVTISYWDFIDQWIESLDYDDPDYEHYVPEETIDTALIRMAQAGIKANPEAITQQLREKIKPWQLKALEQYKRSVEYTYINRHKEVWAECVRLRQEAFTKNWEKRERKKKAEESSYREQARRSNQSFGQKNELLNLTTEEILLFKEVWKSGYRALSIKFHPDKGGDIDKMSALNGLKDKLHLLIN